MARFASAASVSAAIAAGAVLLLSPAPQQAMRVAAGHGPSSPASYASSSGFQPASYLTGGAQALFAEPTRADYAPPPLAQPEIARVEDLQASAGHQVATWVQPRTNARVIWVQDRGLGAPVRTGG